MQSIINCFNSYYLIEIQFGKKHVHFLLGLLVFSSKNTGANEFSLQKFDLCICYAVLLLNNFSLNCSSPAETKISQTEKNFAVTAYGTPKVLAYRKAMRLTDSTLSVISETA